MFSKILAYKESTLNWPSQWINTVLVKWHYKLSAVSTTGKVCLLNNNITTPIEKAFDCIEHGTHTAHAYAYSVYVNYNVHR